MIFKIIDIWQQKNLVDLEENYLKLKLKASGNWPKELEPYQKKEGEIIKVGMLGTNYTEFIEFGRRPNQDQSKEGLRAWVGWAGSTFLAQWVKDKDLDISPFAVAWKIARKGWTVPNKFNDGGLVSSVITKNRINELNKSLTLEYVEQFKSDILKNIKL